MRAALTSSNHAAQRRLAASWRDFFTEFNGTHAVTLSYNNRWGATSHLGYRLTADGEYLPMPMRRVPVAGGEQKLASVRRIPLNRVHADLDQLHRAVDRRLFGSRYHRLAEEERSCFVGWVEHADDNLHAHLVWRVPDQRASEIAQQIEAQWRALGDYHSSAVQPLHDPAGWASYACKDQVGRALEGDPALFVFSRAARGD